MRFVLDAPHLAWDRRNARDDRGQAGRALTRADPIIPRPLHLHMQESPSRAPWPAGTRREPRRPTRPSRLINHSARDEGQRGGRGRYTRLHRAPRTPKVHQADESCATERGVRTCFTASIFLSAPAVLLKPPHPPESLRAAQVSGAPTGASPGSRRRRVGVLGAPTPNSALVALLAYTRAGEVGDSPDALSAPSSQARPAQAPRRRSGGRGRRSPRATCVLR